VIYLTARAGGVRMERTRQPQPSALNAFRMLCLGGAIAAGGAAAVVMASGGGDFEMWGVGVSMHTPQNPLTVMWVCLAGWLLCRWRPAIVPVADARARIRRGISVSCRVGAVFVVGAAPLFWAAAQLIARGEYVSQQYRWRSAPRGVDLIAPLLGHPFHPLMAGVSAPAYVALGQETVEVIAWLGITPIIMLIAARKLRTENGSVDVRVWVTLAIAFTILALGPFVTVAGFDTGLKLPGILFRYVPFAANARIPGRAMIAVYMAVAVVIAMSLRASTGRLRAPAIQWLIIGLVIFEFWVSPIRLTQLDRPEVYRALGVEPPGAVCAVPMGIGDGLSDGVGSQDRSALYYATIHQHPLVGGFIGRMPADAAERYGRLPVAGTLLRLSDGQLATLDQRLQGESPCQYFVVHRGALSPQLSAYLAQLPIELVSTDAQRELYRLRR
jgi:hypothetical protein